MKQNLLYKSTIEIKQQQQRQQQQNQQTVTLHFYLQYALVVEYLKALATDTDFTHESSPADSIRRDLCEGALRRHDFCSLFFH